MFLSNNFFIWLMYHNNFFTEEQWECIRVCVANAPIPYDITMKKIPAEILEKIGQPTPRKGEPLEIPYYDLTPYGINNWNYWENSRSNETY